MKYYVYLIEFNDKSIYVGRTCNVESRLKTHRAKFKDILEFSLIDEGDSSNIIFLERFYINIFSYYGLRLRNKDISKNFTNKVLKTYKRTDKKPVDLSPYIFNIDGKKIFYIPIYEF